jgi:hypothetical protein
MYYDARSETVSVRKNVIYLSLKVPYVGMKVDTYKKATTRYSTRNVHLMSITIKLGANAII